MPPIHHRLCGRGNPDWPRGGPLAHGLCHLGRDHCHLPVNDAPRLMPGRFFMYYFHISAKLYVLRCITFLHFSTGLVGGLMWNSLLMLISFRSGHIRVQAALVLPYPAQRPARGCRHSCRSRFCAGCAADAAISFDSHGWAGRWCSTI